jgi:hypothetical protein
MGIEVDKVSVLDEFKDDSFRNRYFSGRISDTDLPTYITVVPEKCSRQATITFNVDYTALASQVSFLVSLLTALKGFTQLVQAGDWILEKAVNLLHLSAETAKQLADTTPAVIAFQTDFKVEKCESDTKPQVARVAMKVRGTSYTTNAFKTSSRWDLTLNATGAVPANSHGAAPWIVFDEPQTAEWNDSVEVYVFFTDAFVVSPSLTIQTTARSEALATSAAALTVSEIAIDIQVIPRRSWSRLPPRFRTQLSQLLLEEEDLEEDLESDADGN